jgi:hypothetical protein
VPLTGLAAELLQTDRLPARQPQPISTPHYAFDSIPKTMPRPIMTHGWGVVAKGTELQLLLLKVRYTMFV